MKHLSYFAWLLVVLKTFRNEESMQHIGSKQVGLQILPQAAKDF